MADDKTFLKLPIVTPEKSPTPSPTTRDSARGPLSPSPDDEGEPSVKRMRISSLIDLTDSTKPVELTLDDPSLIVKQMTPLLTTSKVLSGEQTTRDALSPSLPPSVQFNIITQYSRLTFMKDLGAQAPLFVTNTMTLMEIQSTLEQLDQVWSLFKSQHQTFGDFCTQEFLEHSYVKDQVYDQGLRAHDLAHRKYTRLQAQLTTSNSSNHTNEKGQLKRFGNAQQRHVPEITLPTFSGDYLSWPSFKDLFSSLITNNQSFSNMEKMRYLKTCVKDSAAQLIATLPLAGSSFDPAWMKLVSKYENKRLLVCTHLDGLTQIKPLAARSATTLQALLTTFTESLNALKALGSPIEHWDQLLVHVVVQKLDSFTRQEWENKLENSAEYPSFHQLRTFLERRAIALKRLEAASVDAVSTPQNKSRSRKRISYNMATTNKTKHQTQPAAPYTCDCCNEAHYIGKCPKFRELTSATRRKIVEEQNLCFNCLGHHSVRMCNTTKTCKICGERHHTMIHVD